MSVRRRSSSKSAPCRMSSTTCKARPRSDLGAGIRGGWSRQAAHMPRPAWVPRTAAALRTQRCSQSVSQSRMVHSPQTTWISDDHIFHGLRAISLAGSNNSGGSGACATFGCDPSHGCFWVPVPSFPELWARVGFMTHAPDDSANPLLGIRHVLGDMSAGLTGSECGRLFAVRRLLRRPADIAEDGEHRRSRRVVGLAVVEHRRHQRVGRAGSALRLIKVRIG